MDHFQYLLNKIKKNRQLGSFHKQALVKKRLTQLFDRVGLLFAKKYQVHTGPVHSFRGG